MMAVTMRLTQAGPVDGPVRRKTRAVAPLRAGAAHWAHRLRLLENDWRSGSAHVGGAGPTRPPPVGLQYGLQCSTEAGQVAVIDAGVVQLLGQFAEQRGPVPPGRLERDPDLDAPLDHLHRRSAGGHSSALFPGSVPAGGRAPLRNRATAARCDRPTAPSAGRRCGAPFSPVRRGAGPVRAPGLGRCRGDVLTPLLLALPPTSPVPRGSTGSHARQVCRRPSSNSSPRVSGAECMRCDGS